MKWNFNVVLSNFDNLHSRKYSSWLEKPIFKLGSNLEFQNRVHWRSVLDLKLLEHGPQCEPTLSSVCNPQGLMNPSLHGHMNYLAISNSIDIYDCWIGLDQIGSCRIQFSILVSDSVWCILSKPRHIFKFWTFWLLQSYGQIHRSTFDIP